MKPGTGLLLLALAGGAFYLTRVDRVSSVALQLVELEGHLPVPVHGVLGAMGVVILALAVLSMTVKFSLSCAIKNWQWTRGRKIYGCGLRAGESVRLKNDLVYGFGSSDTTLAAGTLWHVLQGRPDAPDAVILVDSDGVQLAWVDDLTIYNQFELVG